jgi:hypothetical protein
MEPPGATDQSPSCIESRSRGLCGAFPRQWPEPVAGFRRESLASHFRARSFVSAVAGCRAMLRCGPLELREAAPGRLYGPTGGLRRVYCPPSTRSLMASSRTGLCGRSCEPCLSRRSRQSRFSQFCAKKRRRNTKFPFTFSAPQVTSPSSRGRQAARICCAVLPVFWPAPPLFSMSLETAIAQSGARPPWGARTRGL